jgi:LysM repeat protein
VSGRTRARVLAPVAFLLGVTIIVLLVRAGLEHHTAPTATSATTAASKATMHASAPARRRHRPAPAGRYVIVQKGDTFYSIATAAGIGVARLEALNPGVSPYALRVGQRIRVK